MAGKRRGRPPAQIDRKTAVACAEIQCTDQEIAAVLGVHRDTWAKHLKADPDFSALIQNTREAGKMSLRRLQWRKATGGHVGMLIWLGKQYLGQTESPPPPADNRPINLNFTVRADAVASPNPAAP